MFQFIKKVYRYIFLGVSISTQAQQIKQISLEDSTTITRILNFSSTYVGPRNIELFFPVDYDRNDTTKKYNILYWQDGQNLFDANVAYNNSPLEMQNAMKENGINDLIIIGIWNTEKRYREYLPTKIYKKLDKVLRTAVKIEFSGGALGDEYLKFITSELIPFIQENYIPKSHINNQIIGGTSMGGLISFYATLEYPEIFQQSICVSTHWPISVLRNNIKHCNAISEYIEGSILSQHNYSFYFDHGTENLDAWYEDYQIKINQELTKHTNIAFVSKKYENHSHSEKDWKNRLNFVLQHLIK